MNLGENPTEIYPAITSLMLIIREFAFNCTLASDFFSCSLIFFT